MSYNLHASESKTIQVILRRANPVSDETGTTSIPGDIQSLEVQGTLNDKKKHNLGFYSVWKLNDIIISTIRVLTFCQSRSSPN
jgi:hypothetical protein